MDDPQDTEINELSVNEGAFWHINMDLYYGYQVGDIVEVEHETNKYWLASIYYSYKHLVLLRWIGIQEEFWVDTSSSNFPQNSCSFNLEHTQPKRLYPLGYHSQFHTRSQYDLARPTKFLEKPTLYNPACDPYSSINTVEDLLAHDTELNDQNCVFRNAGKMNESMDLVMANRRAKVAFGQEDAEELAAALQNLDAIDAINYGDQDHIQNSATTPSSDIDKTQQLPSEDSNRKDEICSDALDSGISNGLNDCKSLDEMNAQSNPEANQEKNKHDISDESQACLDQELVELCKNLIHSAITARKYNGIGENSSKIYQVKPKLLYDVGGANHERVFVPGTLVEVCHVEEHENRLRVFQWFAVVLRNTGGRLTLRWFICDEPKFRQGRLDLKSARSEFIRDNMDQEQVEDEENADIKRLPADSIAFSKHFCHPSIQSVASGDADSQRSYLMPSKLRKFIEEVKGQSEADLIQSKLIDAVHDERRKSLDKDRPIIDHIIETAQDLSPKYLKIELELDNTGHPEVLISSPTSTKLLRGIVMSVLQPGVYEIHSDPLPDSGEILKFVFPYDSSYTVLPVSWGSLNQDCLSIAPRVTTPSARESQETTNETLPIENSSTPHQAQCNQIPIVDKDQSKACQSISVNFEVVKPIHFINDGVSNWCIKGSECSMCNGESYNPEYTSQKTEFKCELDESSKDMVTEDFKVMDRLEVAHPSSNITICSGRIRKVVYPLLWIQISPDSYTLLPFNSTEIYPYRWSEFHGHSSISLLPIMKRTNRFDERRRKRQKLSDDSDCEQNHNGFQYSGDQELDKTFDLGKLSDKQIDIDYIFNEKSKYITIYFNHKCFTGPALSKGKICSLPQYVGPGPLRLVMEEVITKVISVAYVPPRILNDLSSRSFEELLISRKLTNTTSMEFKAKYQKRVHREVVQVCVDVNDVALYCECVCEHLKCCYNLFSPQLYDGDDCPGHCRVLTKSNKFMKRATYYREKARLGEFTSDNGNKKKVAAANNNNSDKSARPRYVGRGSSESTNSSVSRNERPNSRASSDDIEDEGTPIEYKENIISEDVDGEEASEIITDKSPINSQNQFATDHIENINNASLTTRKAAFVDGPLEQNEPPVQLQTKSVAEQLFDEFDGLAIDSDLINRWTINDLREYLKSGRMDKFVPIVVTEHIDGEALLLLDDSAIRELFQQYFTKEFTREDVDRFCHFVEYVKFRAKTDGAQTVC